MDAPGGVTGLLLQLVVGLEAGHKLGQAQHAVVVAVERDTNPPPPPRIAARCGRLGSKTETFTPGSILTTTGTLAPSPPCAAAEGAAASLRALRAAASSSSTCACM